MRQNLTQTVTHMGFGVGEINGAERLKSHFSLQQKWHKSPQWSQNSIQTAAHNPEVGGSSPPPATNKPLKSYDFSGFLLFSSLFWQVCFPSFILTQILTHTGNFSGKGWITLERLRDCRRVHSPWFGPLVAERRWSHGRKCPG